MPPRRKYGNRPRAGFDSRKEQRVHAELLLAQRARAPADRVVAIQRQVRYELLPRQNDAAGKFVEHAVTYTADFAVRYGDGREEVIDVKSPATRTLPAYVIKRKLMLFRLGIRVREC